MYPTRQMSLVEQELLIFAMFIPVFRGMRVTRSLVLCVCFVDRCLSFVAFLFLLCCLFFLGLWILIIVWYLQTLLK